METSVKSFNQQLMQLILQSSKATTQVMEMFELAEAGDFETAKAKLQQAKEGSVGAHNVQTSLIQAEMRGETPPVSLLAVHAQDHFMNSQLLLQLSEIILAQQESIAILENKLRKLEMVGE